MKPRIAIFDELFELFLVKLALVLRTQGQLDRLEDHSWVAPEGNPRIQIQPDIPGDFLELGVLREKTGPFCVDAAAGDHSQRKENQ